jgi:hypothetical protein
MYTWAHRLARPEVFTEYIYHYGSRDETPNLHKSIDVVKRTTDPDTDEEFTEREHTVNMVERLSDHLHLITNYIEDRRIDAEVYRRAPGYQPYYDAMYTEHWNSIRIAKSLLSNPDLNDALVDSYIFRLINLTNPATKHTINRLPGLREIYDTIDLPNIRRFSTPSGECLSEALNKCVGRVFEIILRNAEDGDDYLQPYDTLESPQQDEGSVNGDGGDAGDGSGSVSVIPGSGDRVGGQVPTPEELSEIESDVANEFGKRSLGKAEPDVNKLMEAAKKFLAGDVNKKKTSKKMNDLVGAIEDSSTEIDTLDIHDQNYAYIRIPKLTESSLELLPGGMYYSAGYKNDASIARGRQLGQMIVDRVMIRHDNNETKFSRRRSGKIDKRLVHSIGAENYNIFYHNIVDSYKDSLIYLTIDCSGSMWGDKWDSTVALATGLSYAASKINNFDIIVNLRYGLDSIWSITMYDSRRDPYVIFEKWMKGFSEAGGTPESLVYDIELEHIEKLKEPNNNVYFITLTDGQPTYNIGRYYNGTRMGGRKSPHDVNDHCRSIINQFRLSGIPCLAYFITNTNKNSYYPESARRDEEMFKSCYGTSASMVPTDNFSLITKALQTLLIEDSV